MLGLPCKCGSKNINDLNDKWVHEWLWVQTNSIAESNLRKFLICFTLVTDDSSHLLTKSLTRVWRNDSAFHFNLWVLISAELPPPTHASLINGDGRRYSRSLCDSHLRDVKYYRAREPSQYGQAGRRRWQMAPLAIHKHVIQSPLWVYQKTADRNLRPLGNLRRDQTANQQVRWSVLRCTCS